MCGVFVIVGAHQAYAAWNLPSCNPDSVGPTDSSCNVSAPLNVSSSSQTKTGQLTIQNTINGGALAISNSYGGNGTVAITTSTGKSLTVTHSDGTQSAATITTSSNQAGFSLTQNGSGTGGSFTAVAGSGVVAGNNSSTAAALVANNSNAAGTGIYLNMSGNTAVGIDVNMSGSTSYGIKSTVSNSYAGYFTGGGSINSTLFVQNAGSATGANILSNTGVALAVQSTSAAAGTFTSGISSGDVVTVTNSSTGPGLGVSTGGVALSAIGAPSGWPVPAGQGMRATSATSYGVAGYSSASTGYGVGVYGRASNDYGVVGYSDSGYGVYANSQSASSYGSASCNTLSANCAYLGGGTYSGNFTGRVLVSANVLTNPVVSIQNTNTLPAYGYGLSVRTMTGSLTSISADAGTAIDAQAYNGYALFGYSQNGTAAVYGQADNASGYGGQFTVSGASARGVYGVSTNTTSGYGGYFTAAGGTGSAALYASNSGNGGKGVVISTAGIGIDVNTSSTTSDATGIRITAAGGQKGIVINASAAGIDVDSTSGTGIEANDTNIQTTGAYFGGQFYPGGTPSNMQYSNVQPYIVDTIITTSSVGTDRAHGLFFDGSDIWMPTGDSASLSTDAVIQRINAHSNQTTVAYHPNAAWAGSWVAGAMVWARDRMYVFNTGAVSTEFMKIRASNDDASGYGTLAIAGTFRSAVYDGSDIWLGTTSAISRLNLDTDVRTTVQSGLGAIYDMLYVNGFIWALDYTNGVVYKINSAGITVSTITVGTNPTDLEYDGAFIWVANDGDRTLTRINVNTNGQETFNFSTTLTTSVGPLKFDGYRLWLIDDDQLYAYNIRNESLSTPITLTSSGYLDLVYDGNYLWASDGMIINKISIGGGQGYSMPSYPGGIILYGADEEFHCVYFDSAGILQNSTTLTQCQ